jgi:hypothetical protein
MINADIYIHAYIYIEERITDACVRHRRAHVCVGVCARAGRCGSGRPGICAENVRALSVGADGVRLGSQAFHQALVFNVNIGAWNTASVTSLSAVCAAFGPGRRATAAGCARPFFDAARLLCAEAPPMRALVHAHTYRHVAVSCCLHGHAYVHAYVQLP